MRVIVIPGMGCTPIESSNWYLWFRDQVRLKNGSSKSNNDHDTDQKNVECDLYSFPDPYKCRESIWKPFVESKIIDRSQTILIGHSSGAACAMRLLEQYGKESKPIHGCILVAAAYTDLDDVDERESEYFNRPWDWNMMQQGCTNRIILFHGSNDRLIPVDEARYIAQQLTTQYCDYRERDGVSHFFRPYNEFLDAIDSYLN